MKSPRRVASAFLVFFGLGCSAPAEPVKTRLSDDEADAIEGVFVRGTCDPNQPNDQDSWVSHCVGKGANLLAPGSR